MTLPLVQMNKARREVNQQIKHRSIENVDSSENFLTLLVNLFTSKSLKYNNRCYLNVSSVILSKH